MKLPVFDCTYLCLTVVTCVCLWLPVFTGAVCQSVGMELALEA